MFKDVDEIYSMRGQNVSYLNLKDDSAGHEAALRLALGPTGNLRAPAMRKGRTLLVGFNAEAYQDIFEK